MSNTAGDELVEILRSDGSIEGIAPRSVMRANNLWHRATYVLVVRNDLSLVVHQRAAWKDVAPSAWDFAFGGVCGVGEAWVDSAVRELAEEAGLDVAHADLEHLGELRFDAKTTRVHGRAYLVRSDAEVTCPDGEVVDVQEIFVGDAPTWCLDRQVCADSHHSLLPMLLEHVEQDLKRL